MAVQSGAVTTKRPAYQEAHRDRAEQRLAGPAPNHVLAVRQHLPEVMIAKISRGTLKLLGRSVRKVTRFLSPWNAFRIAMQRIGGAVERAGHRPASLLGLAAGHAGVPAKVSRNDRVAACIL